MRHVNAKTNDFFGGDYRVPGIESYVSGRFLSLVRLCGGLCRLVIAGSIRIVSI